MGWFQTTSGGVRDPPITPEGAAKPMAINLKVNGASHTVPAEPDTPLLYVLIQNCNGLRESPPQSSFGG